jgi:hypothetical protein
LDKTPEQRAKEAVDRALGNNTEAAHLHHGRAWLRVEARRLDSDWPGILRLSEAIATWRALNDPNYSRAAA